MLSVSSGLRVASLVKVSLRRNLATSYVAAAAASDPIQQLFVDKVSGVNIRMRPFGPISCFK
jgi:hypothetical protein